METKTQSTNEQAAAILEAAAAIQRRGHCRGMYAQTATGSVADMYSAEAVARCAVGSLRAAARGLGHESEVAEATPAYRTAYDALRGTLDHQGGWYYRGVVAWSDALDPETAAATSAEHMLRAAAWLRAEEGPQT